MVISQAECTEFMSSQAGFSQHLPGDLTADVVGNVHADVVRQELDPASGVG